MTPLIPILSNSSLSLSDTSSNVVNMNRTKVPSPTSLRSSLRCQSDPAFPTAAEGTTSQVTSSMPKRRISFNERVSVREFESNSWVMEMEQLSPVNGPGRKVIAIPQVITFPSSKSGYDSEDSTTSTTTDSSMSMGLHLMLQQEIRTVLMVDPHDIFLKLFSKRWLEALPHVQIVTAHSSEEALELVEHQRFDIVVVEERLTLFHRRGRSGNKLMSGSALISHLKQEAPEQSLLIGVSAHWQSDHSTMVQSGADFCWSKAPAPSLRPAVLEEVLHRLLTKRGKHQIATNLMVASAAAPCGASSPGLQQQPQKQ